MKYQELLHLARTALEARFKEEEIKITDNIKKKYSEKGASFVTLTLSGSLRGCIGSLEARQPLFQDIINNAINAAFHDYRFNPLEENELKRVRIEISVLSPPEKLGIGSKVFNKIDNKMGLILKLSGRSATFLPQVWEQVPDKEVFLEELAMKAGLGSDDWKDAEIWFYRVEKVSE